MVYGIDHSLTGKIDAPKFLITEPDTEEYLPGEL